MTKLFISYGNSVQQTANELCDYLESKGLACWIAPRDISSGNYAGEITRALKASDVVVVICSRESCKSEHVKNEVTMAFNHRKLILPYCLDSNPFDDDLEYYLSSKQHIATCGNARKDFELIETVIRDFRSQRAGAEAPQADAAAVPPAVEIVAPAAGGLKKRRIALPLLIAAAIVAAGLAVMLLRMPVVQKTAEAAPATDSTATVLPEQPASDTSRAQAEAPAAKTPAAATTTPAKPQPKQPADATGTFTGAIQNGYPNGFGTYTFTRRRQIDAHDPEGRIAEPGDYIKGDWKEGHLNYGEWYAADGIRKAFIQLGDQPDTAPDQKLGKCARP